MTHLESLIEFSCNSCVGICAFLVPANLLSTLQTLLFRYWQLPSRWVKVMVFTAFIYSVLMITHVLLWLSMGVVMAPTFILLLLAMVCLGINGWAVINPNSLMIRVQPIFTKVLIMLRIPASLGDFHRLSLAPNLITVDPKNGS